MGHQSSSSLRETNKLFEMPLTQYSLKDRLNSALSIWKNKSIPFDELLEYKTVVNSQEQLAKIYEIFRMRHNHLFLPATKYLTCQQQGIKGCGQYYKGNIYIQSSLASLSIINDIPFFDSLHIYAVAFRGFEILFKKFGYFDVFQDMFHIFDNGRLKVWCNSQLYKLAPEPYLLDTNGREQDMLYRVINIIDENVDKSDRLNMKHLLYNKLMPRTHLQSFDQANIVLRQICKENNWQPPQRLRCISQLTRQDIQRLLIEQQAAQIESRQNIKQLHHMATMNTLNVQQDYNMSLIQGNTSLRIPQISNFQENKIVNYQKGSKINNGVPQMNTPHTEAIPSQTARLPLNKNISMPTILNSRTELFHIPLQAIHPKQQLKRPQQKSLGKHERLILSTQKINPVPNFNNHNLPNGRVVGHNFLPQVKIQKSVQKPPNSANILSKMVRVTNFNSIDSRNLPPRPIVPQAFINSHTMIPHNTQPSRIVQIHQNSLHKLPILSSGSPNPQGVNLQQKNALIQYVQSERYKFSRPQKPNESFEMSKDRFNAFETQDSSHQNKVMKSIVIPDLGIKQAKNEEALTNFNQNGLSGEKNVFTYKQAVTQKFHQSGQFMRKKGSSNFQQRFQQSQQTKKSLPFEQQKKYDKFEITQSQQFNQENTDTPRILIQRRVGRLKSSGTEYTDPKFLQMLSSKDYSNIAIDPVNNANNQSIVNESIGLQQKNGSNGDQLFFSFSNIRSKDKKVRYQQEINKDRERNRESLELGQVRQYLDRVKAKYGDDRIIEKMEDSQKEMNSLFKKQIGQQSGSFNGKRYENSIDKEIWSDLVELRKNKNIY